MKKTFGRIIGICMILSIIMSAFPLFTQASIIEPYYILYHENHFDNGINDITGSILTSDYGVMTYKASSTVTVDGNTGIGIKSGAWGEHNYYTFKDPVSTGILSYSFRTSTPTRTIPGTEGALAQKSRTKINDDYYAMYYGPEYIYGPGDDLKGYCDSSVSVDYTAATVYEIKQVFDLDNDLVKSYVDGELLSTKTLSSDLEISSLDFYWSAVAEYIDDLKIEWSKLESKENYAEGVYRNNAAYIEGWLVSETGGSVTLIAVPKDTELANVTADNLLYWDQVDLEAISPYAFRFQTDYFADEVDIYINDSVARKLSLEEFTGIHSINSDIEINTYDNVDYNVSVSMYDYFDYDSEEYTVYIASYDADGRLVSLDADEKTLSRAVNENYELTFDADVSTAKVFIFKKSNLMPITEAATLYLNAGNVSDNYNLVTTFCGDPETQMGFAWEAPESMVNMVIEYGTSEDELTEVAAYYVEDQIVNRTKTTLDGITRLFYKAELTGLTPGETYYYRIGDKELGYYTDFYSFATAEEDLTEFSIIGITDVQANNENNFAYLTKTMNAALEECPDAKFFCNVGDYGVNGSEDDIWDMYFNSLKGISETLPAVAAMGNHETYTLESGANGPENFALRFNNPKNAYGLADDSTYTAANEYTPNLLKYMDGSVYSFDYGNTHFSVLNTGSEKSIADMTYFLQLQAEWLKNDLANTDATWKVVLVHRGVYYVKDRSAGDEVKDVLLDVIDEYGVDLVLQGHDHVYMRTYQMKGDEIVDVNETNELTKGNGTVYTILGSAGTKRYSDLDEYSHTYEKLRVDVPQYDPSYVIINFSEDTLEMIGKTKNGTELDRFTITK